MEEEESVERASSSEEYGLESLRTREEAKNAQAKSVSVCPWCSEEEESELVRERGPYIPSATPQDPTTTLPHEGKGECRSGVVVVGEARRGT